MSKSLALLAFVLAGCAAPGQEEEAPHRSLDLGYADYGLSFGDSPRWRGIRVNFQDGAFQDVRGLNLTLWTPKPEPDSRLIGIAAGLCGPGAGRITGISLGLVSVLALERMRGLQASGLATISEGRICGISASGLATIAKGDLCGLALSGIATLARQNMTGIQASGFLTLAEGNMTGAHLSLFSTYAEGAMTGLNVAGGAVLSGTRLRGINLAGLGLGAEAWPAPAQEGAPLAGPDAETPPPRRASVEGLSVSLRIVADELLGLSVAGAQCRARVMKGVSVALLNRFAETQQGVAIGLFNHAAALEGFGCQLGLVNHVAENPPLLRWLPVFNTRF